MVARSGESLEGSGETNANLRTKMNKRLSVVKGHYKLVDCAHFHYDHVDFGSIQLQLVSEPEAGWTSGCSPKDLLYMVQVTCQGKSWMVRRSYEEFGTLDAHLHQCIYDRRYSQLLPLPTLAHTDTVQVLSLLSEYLTRLSVIVDNKLNCGPVLTWLEIDNHGNRFLLKEEASLNVPAIAAAHVIKRYTAQASDEISIEVGDILSVIDMPPKEETSWWRGKHGFQVGFFPSECVELINEKLHQSVSTTQSKTDPDPSTGSPGPASPTSVSRRHGKLLGFLRTFIKSRPSKQKLKQRGILKERVFGCDLGEHLLNSGLDVPQVLVSCSEFIEQHGVVDGIYRHSGVSSNIQKLRHEFDSELVPDLTKEVYMQDIHCVGSLCKLYFRELPNPLLTYQLYDKFADCMGDMTDEDRMVKVHDVIQQLPPPHYRTLEFLIRHLARLATCSAETNMHIKNLAIVWAPNLLRSKEIETAGLVGSDPFREVRVQSVVVEFLLSHVDVLFSDSFTSVGKFTQGGQSLSRPKSFVSTRLLSLEEAQARSQAPQLLQGVPAPLQQSQYHTVLDIQDNRRKRGLKGRKAGSWKMFFAIGKPTRKPTRISSLFQPTTSHAGCRVDSVTLRSAKSEESLSSQHSGAGVQRLRRPRSSSDGLSLAAAMETQPLPHRPPSRLPSSRSYDSLLLGDQRHGDEEEEEEDGEDEEDEDEEGVYMLPDFSTNQEPVSSWMAEDVIDFSPTFLEDGPIGLGSTRDSPPTGSPPAYHCHSHQAQRPITEDPDSVLNQSEAVARRSLILAATAPPQQVFCQHRPSNSSPAQAEAANQSPSHGVGLPPERRSFTKKVVHALSSKAPKSPPLDISQPIAISVPAKVLEMIGGRAGESQPSAPGVSAPPPQMISMLLRSCDFQLSDSCQQELRSKLGASGPAPSHAPGAGKGIPGPTGAPLPPQQPPLPPPKNPARLMALALAESANRALRHQGASPPYRPPQTGPDNKGDSDSHYQCSLSADAGELLNSEANQLYSTVSQRPLAVCRNNSRTQTQDTGTLSSETSVSDSVASDLSGGSSSGDDHSPSPVYTNQSQNSRRSPSQSTRKKPPAYGRQLSAPPLQQKAPNTTTPVTTASVSVSTQNISTSTSSQLLPYPPLQHSRSESSPLSLVQAFQPSRPKVPPKPLDLVPPHRDQRERHLLAKSDLRRSLDSGRIRHLIGQPTSQPPLARAFSERLSGAPDRLARYHAARTASQPVSLPPPPAQAQLPGQAEEQERGERMENFYYEIGAPEADGPPSYARHSYLNMRLDLEGNLRPAPCCHPDAPRALARGYQAYQGGAGGRGGQLWSSEATRAWAAAHSMRSHDNRPRPQRHPCSSVRLTARSEMHPLPSSSFSPLLPPNPSSYPFAPPLLRGGPARSSDPAHTPHPSPLHPYFENGRVCYRSQPDDTHAHTNTHTQPQTNQPQASQRHDRQLSKNQSEPIYVNYPFTTSSSRGWATSDLDPPLNSSPLSPLLLTPPEEQGDLPSPTSPPSPAPPTTESQPAPDHSPSHLYDPQREGGVEGEEGERQADGLSGQDIAALLMERMVEEEREERREGDPSTHSSSSSCSSSPQIHPPNPYAPPSAPPPPSSSSHHASFQRGEVLRRSSSGGGHFYRQAFDVLPSGDQLLRFHRSPPPYPPQRSSYPSHPPPPPSAALANLSLGGPRGFYAPQPHYPPRRELAPEGPPLQGQRGLVRQGSLPGASWSQTRSYC